MEKITFNHSSWTGSKVNSLVTKYTPEVVKEHFGTKKKLAEFYRLAEEDFSDAEVEYASALAAIQTRELLIGHFKYRNLRGLDSREKQLYTKNTFQGLLINEHFPHEVRHSIIALALNEDKESPASLRPLFQKVGPLGIFFEAILPRCLKQRLLLEETLVVAVLQGPDIPHALENLSSYASEHFLSQYLQSNATDALLQKFVRSFAAYPRDERLYWNFVVDTTTPLMRKHAPHAAEKLLSMRG